jgi:GrpB-like predicted nucleotidyltransferase (UPF0157 family)
MGGLILRAAGFEDSLSAIADGLTLRPAESRPRKRGSAPRIADWRHILLRNYLRSHPAEVSAYANLKWSLFARFANDRAAYIQGKADFVEQLVQRATAQS